ncbi:ClpP/crotonase-like domain-containing protein [Exophiala viscosa]|uniref:ClpP/crotonase-like domain-containing protein n=1 Tax=Exophiala viscosa TaxID=2486360 RepID=A0AAN6E1D6_9EURO|nr:ClpP/crotonase-like domain-containing protein [Exophiala viscosa]
MSSKTELPPPSSDPSVILSYPAPHVLLVTINRVRQMNSIPMPVHWYLHRVFEWFDREPTLRVAVITGAGPKSFCAGQDLIEMGKRDPKEIEEKPYLAMHPPTGFAGVSRRLGKKPVIAAVNGFALGGGFEIVLNCDMVVASPTATFGLPEALRGIYAGAGGLPRLVRNVGLPLASEISMAARTLSAKEALQFQLINHISSSQETCVPEAVKLAAKVADISPDSIVITRAALRQTWEDSSVERAFQNIEDRMKRGLMEGENSKEGLTAFREKRKPVWRASKL